MFATTACGRDMLNTPMSVKWEEFKKEPIEHRCTKCDASKQAVFNTRVDFQKFINSHVEVIHIGAQA